jgi:site-specific DNA recombinase
MLRDTACMGRAGCGRPHPARKPSAQIPAPREERIETPVPALVAPAVLEAAQAPARREPSPPPRAARAARDGRSQGRVACRRCGCAFRGKMARGRVGGQRPAGCGTCRCTGADAQRFAVSGGLR